MLRILCFISTRHALDLTGINNHNEYFSSHYLAALIEGDLKDTLARWKETAEAHPDSEAHRSPDRRIFLLAKPYFHLLNRYVALRDPAERLAAQREFLPRLLDALGYAYQPSWRSVGPTGTPPAKCLRLPLLGEVTKSSGAPWLWIVEALPPADEPETDPLSLPVHSTQFDGDPAHNDPQLASPHPSRDLAWDEIVTRHIYSLDEAPRWILLLSLGHAVLLDRTKWPEKRHLSFDLREILNRRESSTLQATAALLHRESICPADGLALLDGLDENSHRHSFSVSEDLKDAVRECVELLANEAVYYLREVRKEAVFSTPDEKLARDLTGDCLRYLYRLLFCLYLEARPELGYLPVKSEVYLRELQRVKMRLADNNVFGVDLNPVAVELAEISLWLNTIHEGAFVPWFGLQLAHGNSLVGARRASRPAGLLKILPNAKGKTATKPRWPDAVPSPVKWSSHPARDLCQPSESGAMIHTPIQPSQRESFSTPT